MATLYVLRRQVVCVVPMVALALAASASASLRPVDRSFGEVSTPRVRAGTIQVPQAHRSGRVTVIATLSLPPLAAARGPGFFATLGSSRLNTASSSSKAYLARVAALQRVAAREIHASVPSARLGDRFQVVLNGITINLPVTRLPELAALPGIANVYPSRRFTLHTNRSPAVIGVPSFSAATGTAGQGVKIGIVDDGVDQTNPYLDPAGFTYPAGFPKGQTRFTTPKVIVARSFPGPGAGAPGRLALDRRTSFHGTHVGGIAAGNSGNNSPGGRDHPPAAGLSGVAPRAWIGNYRVFNIPTPIGNNANTPQIVAAFESAVRDGMDVINFSGGGPATEPQTDAMIQTVANTAAAGVAPVISAGNDRDDFGAGSTGSPGTAPEAITVAAASNTHVFAPTIGATDPAAPVSVQRVPFRTSSAWGTVDRTLVDVGTITGSNGQPVSSQLCGIGNDPNAGRNPLPRGSLAGSLALISRGHCTFFSKAVRALAAGANGLVVIDNRAGEPNGIPAVLPLRSGMVSDLDGGNLRAYLASRGGRAPVRIGPTTEIETGRSGIITSFSSAGPTQFTHALKPDVAAPGGEILSSTLREYTGGSPFASFDGTSMSAPHVAGVAALLKQRHRDWSVRQLKSAIASTAGPAWGNTARTQEASVLLQGAGMVNVGAADDPRVFTEPSSLAFGDLNVLGGQTFKQLLLSVRDAGGGAGTWTVEVRPQSASAGATIEVPSTVSLGPGGSASLPVSARVDSSAPAGDNVGFLVLRQGLVTRRIAYAFFVTRPGLTAVRARALRKFQRGTTRGRISHVDRYRFPSAPFGHSPDYGVGPDMRESGSESVYELVLRKRAINFGAAVVSSSPGSLIDVWALGSKDENDVQGYAGTPVNINGITFGYRLPIGAAGAQFPIAGTYYIAVDSGRDEFTGRLQAGTFRLRSWVNDVRKPRVRLLTTQVTAGRPTIAVQITDAGAGVDPYSLAFNYGRTLIGAAGFDPASGIALFPLPPAAPQIGAGRTRAVFQASDYQEAKNANTYNRDLMPNTRIFQTRLRVVRKPTLTWLTPVPRGCVARPTPLLVVAGSTKKVGSVRFFDGKRRIGLDRRGVAGLYSMIWKSGRAKRGAHTLRAVVQSGGARLEAKRVVRVCR